MKMLKKIYERSNNEFSVSMSQSLVGGIETDLPARCRIVDAQHHPVTNKQNKQTNKLGNKEASKEPSKKRMNQANKQINKQMQFKVANAHHNPLTPVHQTPYNRQ